MRICSEGAPCLSKVLRALRLLDSSGAVPGFADIYSARGVDCYGAAGETLSLLERRYVPLLEKSQVPAISGGRRCYWGLYANNVFLITDTCTVRIEKCSGRYAVKMYKRSPWSGWLFTRDQTWFNDGSVNLAAYMRVLLRNEQLWLVYGSLEETFALVG